MTRRAFSEPIDRKVDKLTFVKIDDFAFLHQSQLSHGCPAALADSQLMVTHVVEL